MSAGPTEVAAAAGWQVRPARDDDADGLVALIGAVFAEYEGCVIDLDDLDADLLAWRSHLEARGGDGWVVVDEGGLLVACVGVTPTGPGRAELKRLYVRADARGRGLGAALVTQVEAWARDHGAHEVVLWSDTRFLDAHRLYERRGYRRTGRSRDLHDPSDTTEDQFLRVLP